MVRLLWRTDVHLSDRAPVSRKDDWVTTVFGKLDQTRMVAEKAKVHAILDGGDFFHIKSPSRNSHRLVRQVADHHSKYPCPVYCTPGNHDSVYGDYAFLEQQPLGVLFASGVFRRLYDEHEAVFEEGGVKVRVVGVPYHGSKYDKDRLARITKGAEDYLVCVAHLLASPSGGSMFEDEDILSYRDMAKMAPDIWLLGHWHKDQGVVEVGGKKFVNVGAMTRGSIVQDEVERRPAIVLMSFSKGEVEIRALRLRTAPADEVFDLDARTRAEARTMTLDAFVASVRETLVDSHHGTLEDTVGEMKDIPEKIREKALLYLERV